MLGRPFLRTVVGSVNPYVQPFGRASAHAPYHPWVCLPALPAPPCSWSVHGTPASPWTSLTTSGPPTSTGKAATSTTSPISPPSWKSSPAGSPAPFPSPSPRHPPPLALQGRMGHRRQPGRRSKRPPLPLARLPLPPARPALSPRHRLGDSGDGTPARSGPAPAFSPRSSFPSNPPLSAMAF